MFLGIAALGIYYVSSYSIFIAFYLYLITSGFAASRNSPRPFLTPLSGFFRSEKIVAPKESGVGGFIGGKSQE